MISIYSMGDRTEITKLSSDGSIDPSKPDTFVLSNINLDTDGYYYVNIETGFVLGKELCEIEVKSYYYGFSFCVITSTIEIPEIETGTDVTPNADSTSMAAISAISLTYSIETTYPNSETFLTITPDNSRPTIQLSTYDNEYTSNPGKTVSIAVNLVKNGAYQISVPEGYVVKEDTCDIASASYDFSFCLLIPAEVVTFVPTHLEVVELTNQLQLVYDKDITRPTAKATLTIKLLKDDSEQYSIDSDNQTNYVISSNTLTVSGFNLIVDTNYYTDFEKGFVTTCACEGPQCTDSSAVDGLTQWKFCFKLPPVILEELYSPMTQTIIPTRSVLTIYYDQMVFRPTSKKYMYIRYESDSAYIVDRIDSSTSTQLQIDNQTVTITGLNFKTNEHIYVDMESGFLEGHHCEEMQETAAHGGGKEWQLCTLDFLITFYHITFTANNIHQLDTIQINYNQEIAKSSTAALLYLYSTPGQRLIFTISSASDKVKVAGEEIFMDVRSENIILQPQSSYYLQIDEGFVENTETNLCFTISPSVDDSTALDFETSPATTVSTTTAASEAVREITAKAITSLTSPQSATTTALPTKTTSTTPTPLQVTPTTTDMFTSLSPQVTELATTTIFPAFDIIEDVFERTTVESTTTLSTTTTVSTTENSFNVIPVCQCLLNIDQFGSIDSMEIEETPMNTNDQKEVYESYLTDLQVRKDGIDTIEREIVACKSELGNQIPIYDFFDGIRNSVLDAFDTCNEMLNLINEERNKNELKKLDISQAYANLRAKADEFQL